LIDLAIISRAGFYDFPGLEVVLAGELEIPIALLGFGVDYANGVSAVPTPVEVLRLNLINSKGVFLSILEKLINYFKEPRYTGFIYRFDEAGCR
jgi:5'-methylthioadenosine phosphorylase